MVLNSDLTAARVCISSAGPRQSLASPDLKAESILAFKLFIFESVSSNAPAKRTVASDKDILMESTLMILASKFENNLFTNLSMSFDHRDIYLYISVVSIFELAFLSDFVELCAAELSHLETLSHLCCQLSNFTHFLSYVQLVYLQSEIK